MTEPAHLIGMILAGGQSRRMGGPEKSLLKLDGSTLLERATTRLSKQVDTLIINANGDANRFGKQPYAIIADTLEGFAGPLAGVLAGLRWAQKKGPANAQLITVAADTPFFPLDYCKRLMAVQKTEKSISFASSNLRTHPVFGIWTLDLADPLEKFLVEEGNRKVLLFAERYSLSIHDFPMPHVGKTELDMFFNINMPEDLVKAEEQLAEWERIENGS